MDYIKNDGLVQIIKNAEYDFNNLSMLTGEEMSNTLVQIFKFISGNLPLYIECIKDKNPKE